MSEHTTVHDVVEVRWCDEDEEVPAPVEEDDTGVENHEDSDQKMFHEDDTKQKTKHWTENNETNNDVSNPTHYNIASTSNIFGRFHNLPLCSQLHGSSQAMSINVDACPS